MRASLLLAASYHILFALWTNFWPYHFFDLLEIPRPNHPLIWRSIGITSGLLGLVFLIASSNPIRHWLVSLLGLGKTIGVTGFVVFSVILGKAPVSSYFLLFINDVIWITPFGMILWATVRAHIGIPANRKTPYTPQEAAELYPLSNGFSLAEAADKELLVLVFLRHFGCTFTRQLLQGLQKLEQEAKKQNAKLVLVHMLKSGQEMEYLDSNTEIYRIADPQCELYRAFGLGKGGFMELFGPRVLWRSILSLIKGCGVGHLAGDGLQMPGAFLYSKGKILASQPARNAAELPALSQLFSK